jgi:hypothetical protein
MTTGFEVERQSIEDEFNTGWVSSTCPIKFQNLNGLVKGTSMINDVKGLTKWCRLEILPAASNNAVVGGTTIRHFGNIVINLFTKSGTGSDTIRELADDVYDIFKNKTFDGIHCEAPFFTIEGNNEEWFQATVTIPYYRDQGV